MKKTPDQTDIPIDEIVLAFNFAGRGLRERAIFPQSSTSGALILDSFDLMTQRMRAALVQELRSAPVREGRNAPRGLAS